MGIGSARGDDRAVQAAELAISSPLLEASIDGAHGVLLSIQGGSDLGLFEINEAARLVQEAAHPEANIIFGAVIDDALGDEVRVTVIAAGFDGGGPVQAGRRPGPRPDRRVARARAGPGAAAAAELPAAAAGRSAPVPSQSQQAPASSRSPSRSSGRQPQPVQQQPQQPQRAPEPVRQQQEPVARPPRTVTFDDNDDLDVPGLPEVVRLAAPSRAQGRSADPADRPCGVPDRGAVSVVRVWRWREQGPVGATRIERGRLGRSPTRGRRQPGDRAPASTSAVTSVTTRPTSRRTGRGWPRRWACPASGCSS